MRIARELYDRIVDHARREAPLECCGMVGVQDDEIVLVQPVANAARSRLRFEMDPAEQFSVYSMIEEDRGLDVGAYHSHPVSPARPSQTDLNLMSRGWPGTLQLLVSLERDEPAVAVFRVAADAGVEDLALEVV